MGRLRPKLILVILLLIVVVIIISKNISFDMDSFKMKLAIKDPQITDVKETRLGNVYTIYNPNRDKMEIEVVKSCGGVETSNTIVLLGKKEMRYSVQPDCKDFELVLRKI